MTKLEEADIADNPPRRLIGELCRSCPLPHTFYYEEGEPEKVQCPKCARTILRGHYGCQRPRGWWGLPADIVDDLSQAWERYSNGERMQRPDRCCHELYRQVFDLENEVRRRLELPQRHWPESGMNPPPADGLSRQERLGRSDAEKETQEAVTPNHGQGEQGTADGRGTVDSMGESIRATRRGHWFTRLWGETQ